MFKPVGIIPASGVLPPKYRGLSAKQLRQIDPAYADQWAAWLAVNKDALAAQITGALRKAGA